jgi:hypothetical protein
MAAAAVTLTISAKAEAQLRRIARKREAHLTLSQRMDLAVLRNPQADAWGAADWQSGAIYQPKAGVV